MVSSPKHHALDFTPGFSNKDARAVVDEFARRIRPMAAGALPEPDGIRRLLRETLAAGDRWPKSDRTKLRATLSVLADLALQGWGIRRHAGRIKLTPPDATEGPSAEKERIRHQELLARDAQLATPSVAAFVRSMERRQVRGQQHGSIFSLMRDGRALAAQLRALRDRPPETRAAALAEVLAPYLQFVDEDTRCEHTGLRLMDVWRYFRHTWANQYVSVPGRSMMFLVRDRAAANHPVIGIAAISSAVVQIRERDMWIGWHPEAFLEHAQEHPSPELGSWMKRIVDDAIDEFFIQDLYEEKRDGGVLSPDQLKAPTPEVVATLRQLSAECRARHRKTAYAKEHKPNPSSGETVWAERTKTDLFVSKRALALAELLEARMVLREFLGACPTKAGFAEMLADSRGRKAFLRVARKAKADRVGVAIADITVCGAVAPYNPLLGGKLVSLLAASPEVVSAYRRRYSNVASDIASSMAGRAIHRPADLVFLGTTSLYGRSSQYNRVRMPAERLGGSAGAELRFRELGASQGYGTSHFSAETFAALGDLLIEAGQDHVNYIFGEGTSAKLRRIRDALELLGFPPNDVIRHGRKRDVYGVSLVSNLRDYLVGIDTRPEYLFGSQGAKATDAIAAWWRERWLARRIESDEVLEQVAAHNLIRPIRHGARVPLPENHEALLDLDWNE